MSRYAMMIDMERCVGCQACTVACKSEWVVPLGGARTRVRPAGTVGDYPNFSSVFYVSQCNHCDRPSCVPACPTGATYQDSTGAVRVHRDLCIGCGSCVAACPYDARYIDSAAGKVDKCDFCADRVEKGLEPACVLTCPTKAKSFGDLEDSSGTLFKTVYHGGAKRVQSSDVEIGPNVYYQASPAHFQMSSMAFAPHPPRVIAATRVWGTVAEKLVFLAVGATFLGQAVAFFRQLAAGEHQFEE